MSMNVLIPVDTTDATLTASNIPETDYTAWSNLTDYVLSDYVISTATHTVYRALVASGPSGVGAVDPDVEAANFADPLVDTSATTRYWQIISATNKWKLFDKKPSVQSTNSTTIDVTITPGEITDGIGLFNLDAGSVQVIVTSVADGEVYNETTSLTDNSGVTDWYSYFFSPVDELSDLTVVGFPPYGDASIQIIITRTGGIAKCGQIVLGRMRELGDTTTDGSGFDGYDFSTITTDVFGNIETTQRAATRVNRFRVAVTSTRLQSVSNVLRGLRGGVSAVWIGAEDDRIAALNYGFARDWRVDYEDTTADLSYLTLEIQGIV